MEEIKLQILSEHYKDTFLHMQGYLMLRSKRFFYLIIFVSVLLFQQYSPNFFQNVLSQVILKQIELKVDIDLSFVGSIIWFCLLGITVLYFQVNVLINRQYKYIHKLEIKLNSYYEEIE